MTTRDSISAVTSGLRVDSSASANNRPTWRNLVLRGGRVTKYKGIGCGIAPCCGAVAAASVVSLAAMLLPSTAAVAGVCEPGVNVVCSGAAGAPGTDAPVVINEPSPVTVTTEPGFGINAGGGFAAITITGTGVGNITFTDVNQSAITSTTNVGIRVYSQNTGAVSIQTNGVITSASTGVGVDMGANTTDVTLRLNDVDAGAHGIHVAGNVGTGNVLITANDVKANNIGINIDAGAQTQDFTVNVNSITTSVDDGIFGYASGTGNVNITVRDSIVAEGVGGVFGDGIEFNRDNAATGQFNVTVNDVKASGRGLALAQFSTAVADQTANSLNVTTNGKIDAGNWAIWTETNPGVLSNITVKSTSVLVSGTDQAIFNDDGDSRVIIENAAEVVNDPNTPEAEMNSVNGVIRLSGGADQLDLLGGFSGITEVNGGGGGTNSDDVLNLVGAISTTYDANKIVGWDVFNINGSYLTTVGGLGNLDVGTAGVAGTGIFLTNGSTLESNQRGMNIGGNLTLAAGTTFLSDVNNDAGNPGQGDTRISGFLTNAGTVSIADEAADDNVSVAGLYTGNGGTIVIDTVLGDDSSATDKMFFNGGTAAGNTFLKVNNIGGAGAPTVEGIKVIDVSGASDGEFSLVGDYQIGGKQAVVTGAFGYTLWKNGISAPGDGDWYLRSWDDGGPIYQPGAAIYESYAQALLGMNGLPTLKQRVGNRYWSDAPTPKDASSSEAGLVNNTGVWGVIEGSYGEFQPDSSTTGAEYDQDIWKMRFGFDGLISETESGKLIGGIMASFGRGSTDISSKFGSGDISSDAYGAGVTATWYGNSGLYLDGQAQATWFDSDLSSDWVGDLASGNNGFGYALSMEAGKRVDAGKDWALIPQAQLVYSNVRFDSFTDPFGAEVEKDQADSLRARFGLAAEREASWADEQGEVVRAAFYGIANLNYELLDGTSVNVADTQIESQNDRAWGEIGAGGTYSWNDDSYALFGELSTSSSLQNFADSYVVKGTAGLRINW